MFDGSDGAKAFRAISFVGRQKPAGSIARDAENPAARPLMGNVAWPMTVSYFAHGAEITDDVAERTRVTAWREGLSLIGVFLASAVPEVLKQASGERAGFAQFSWLFVPLALALAWVAVRGSPPAHGRLPPAGTAIFGAFALPFRNPRFRPLLTGEGDPEAARERLAVAAWAGEAPIGLAFLSRGSPEGVRELLSIWTFSPTKAPNRAIITPSRPATDASPPTTERAASRATQERSSRQASSDASIDNCSAVLVVPRV